MLNSIARASMYSSVVVCPSYVSVLASSGLHAWTCSCESVRVRLRVRRTLTTCTRNDMINVVCFSQGLHLGIYIFFPFIRDDGMKNFEIWKEPTTQYFNHRLACLIFARANYSRACSSINQSADGYMTFSRLWHI